MRFLDRSRSNQSLHQCKHPLIYRPMCTSLPADGHFPGETRMLGLGLG